MAASKRAQQAVAAPSRPRLPPGAMLGSWKIVAHCAAGGMGDVYAACRQLDGLRSPVYVGAALKAVPVSAGMAMRFEHEVLLGSLLDCAHFPQVLDYGKAKYAGVEMLFLAQKLIRGVPLSRIALAGPGAGPLIPRAVSCRIVLDVLIALAALHDLKDDDGAPLDVVHRDVSPPNIMIGADGRAQLVDLGVTESRKFPAGPDQVSGKFGYMAPEQARAERCDRRADLWSLGLVFWELLSGQRKYPAMSELEPRLAVNHIPVPLIDDLAPELARVVDKALSLNPAHRHRTAQGFAADLDAAMRALGLEATHDDVARLVSEMLGPERPRPPRDPKDRDRDSAPPVSGPRPTARAPEFPSPPNQTQNLGPARGSPRPGSLLMELSRRRSALWLAAGFSAVILPAMIVGYELRKPSVGNDPPVTHVKTKRAAPVKSPSPTTSRAAPGHDKADSPRVIDIDDVAIGGDTPRAPAAPRSTASGARQTPPTPRSALDAGSIAQPKVTLEIREIVDPWPDAGAGTGTTSR